LTGVETVLYGVIQSLFGLCIIRAYLCFQRAVSTILSVLNAEPRPLHNGPLAVLHPLLLQYVCCTFLLFFISLTWPLQPHLLSHLHGLTSSLTCHPQPCLLSYLSFTTTFSAVLPVLQRSLV
jgi:hypothetical protein